ncbi:MAG: hypothetical protein JEZ11_03980 [Desulfobacterales bacterium]|nr:hypothetical protein [Desulfobacterales bacterium]
MKQSKTVIDVIKSLIAIKNIDEFALRPEENAVASQHHVLGRNLRNGLCLWNPESVIAKEFNQIGISHPDDMSGILLTTLHRILNFNQIDLRGQVAEYQKYWASYPAEGIEE